MIIFRHWCWSFLGVVIESIPFIVMGAIISTIIQFYITEEVIRRIVPKRKVLAFLASAFMGLANPIKADARKARTFLLGTIRLITSSVI